MFFQHYLKRYEFILCGGFLAFACCGSANGQTNPLVSIDLRAKGLPSDAFKSQNCPYEYFGYRAVEWIDSQRLLVAFNTSADCAKKERLQPGSLRLITFDLQGNTLHSTDIAYDAGYGDAFPVLLHDGIWVGPNKTIIVDIPGAHLKELPDSHDRVLVFSDEMTQIQEMDTDDHDRIGDGIHLAGVTPDRQRILFWTARYQIERRRTCLSYSSVPMTNAKECSEQDLDSVDPQVERDVIPKGYEARAFAGSSTDGLRSSAFAVREENFFCQMFGKFCPSKGKLLVFETNTKHVLMEKSLPTDGRAALSFDGTRLVVLEDSRLKIFAVP